MADYSPQQVAQLFRDLFETDLRGRQALALLERRFCTGDAVLTNGGIDAVLKTYRKAAHRELLDYIHSQIERASQDPTDTPQAKTENP